MQDNPSVLWYCYQWGPANLKEIVKTPVLRFTFYLKIKTYLWVQFIRWCLWHLELVPENVFSIMVKKNKKMKSMLTNL